MPDSTYVTVTLLPRCTLTKQVAGEPKKYLVEVTKKVIEDTGASATGLAIEAALSADYAQYGFTPTDITRNIDHFVTEIPQDSELPNAPYEFENCRVWVIPATKTTPIG